jgi:hypothetical protein
MTSQGPPEEEDVENGRGLLVLLVDTVDALGFDAHFLVKPFLSSAHAPQKSRLLLELSCPDHLLRIGIRSGLVCGGGLPFDIVALRLDVVGALDIVRVPHIGLVAMNEVRHCCETEIQSREGERKREKRESEEKRTATAAYFSQGGICVGPAAFVLPPLITLPSF